MLEGIRKFFGERMAPAEDNAARDSERIQLAACALLLELAYADDEFSGAERAHIESVLLRHFNLDAASASALMSLADQERKQAVDLWQFTSLIAQRYDLGQKMLLAEVMWGLILADGAVAEHEAYLVRKMANLLGLEAGYLSQARANVAGRLP
jgi:uncharacterized tellurite resistance protein B-like protein